MTHSFGTRNSLHARAGDALRWAGRLILLIMALTLYAGEARSQEPAKTSVVVQALDEQGAFIRGARARLVDASGREQSGVSDTEGLIVFPDLASGSYSLSVNAESFSGYEDKSLTVASGEEKRLRVMLRVTGIEAKIAVFTSILPVQLSGGDIIITGDALAALTGVGGLEELLRALALRTGGPFGPPVLVDGFENGVLPSGNSIREIRIKDNPFSAEYSTLGLGRIEILTKPGTEKLRVSAFTNRGDALLNSRNPFASDKPQYESDTYGGNISGPIIRGKSTYFIDFNRAETDTNAVINATVINSLGAIVPLQQTVVTPQWRKSFSPRVDFQLSPHNTLVLRYGDARTHDDNAGIGEFSLLSRKQETSGRSQTFQLTETALFGPTVNETRAQVVRSKTLRFGDNSGPVINVPGAFTGGGADLGIAYNRQTLAEFQNFTASQGEKHSLKVGLQWRGIWQTEGSTQNFNGTYTFASRIAPQLNANNQAVLDSGGAPVMIPITTIEAYRRTVLFAQQGMPADQARQLGAGASQFSVREGEVQVSANQYQLGMYVQDDWRIVPSFTLSAGARYEIQSDVLKRDFAPRLSFAWGIGKSKSRTVVRGGIGIFNDRIPDRLALRVQESDGFHQRQYVIADESVLNLFPAVPTPDVIVHFGTSRTSVLLGDLETPYTINSSLSAERQILPGLTLAATVSEARSMHVLRSRNINAPLPGTYDPAAPQNAVKPYPALGDLLQYETNGVSRQRQLLVNLIWRAGKNMTLWSTYTLSRTKSDTDSPDTFPSDSYDLSREYSRSSQQAPHTVYLGGWIRLPGGVDLTPLTLWRAGVPFNITTGQDRNGDTLYTDRPSFATDLSRPSVVVTQYGTFDLAPMTGQQIIPRNYGDSPGFFIANLRVAKTFPMTRKTALTMSIQGTNIFNRTNLGTPIGNLGSSLFGTSNISAGDWGFGANQAGNRRFEAMMHVAFQ